MKGDILCNIHSLDSLHRNHYDLCNTQLTVFIKISYTPRMMSAACLHAHLAPHRDGIYYPLVSWRGDL